MDKPGVFIHRWRIGAGFRAGSCQISGILLVSPYSYMATKRTYQRKKLRRVRVHGFRARMATRGGREVLARRRAKGRRRVAVTKVNP